MKTSLRPTATPLPQRRSQLRVNDRPYPKTRPSGQHPRRQFLRLAVGAGALPAVSRALVLLAVVWAPSTHAQSIVPDLEQEVRLRAAQVESKLIAWRRDIHEHPELGEQETRTSSLVASHLASLGLQLKTGVAGTGVVAILKGGKRGPVVALRAELDALPVKEPNGLAFASKAKGGYLGREVDVMHACGHDAHAAILMATAEVVTAMKDKLPGAVKFIFQPAEEGPTLYAAANDKIWGAKLMIKEGVLQDPKPDALFALHVVSTLPAGRIAYRGGPALAGGDELRIKVTGRQGNAGVPWRTIDPVTTAAQIVLGLQTIVSGAPTSSSPRLWSAWRPSTADRALISCLPPLT